MREKIKRAASLAAWLMSTEGVKRNVALIITSNKHSIPKEYRPILSKAATIYKNNYKQQRGLFD